MEQIYSRGDIVLGQDGKKWIVDRLNLMGGYAGYESWSYYDVISIDFKDYTNLEPEDIVKYLGRFDIIELDKALERIVCA